tara:strand:- start:902 stop:1576 length:675 start_codon:yes stop_codon:yes gene_type:complete
MSELMDATISYLDANPPAQVQAVDRHPDKALSFYNNIGVHAESDHGDLPIRTHDKREAHLPEEQRSFDVGYGHKLTETELKSGTIYGIPFERGLTAENKTNILNKDMANNIKIARDRSWDKKLKEKGGSWDKIDHGFQLVLTSLAYNVGGTRAADDWDRVLDEALNGDVKQFAKQARRQDNKKNTAGMDNRVLKEMYYAGLIKKASEVKDVLPLGSAKEAGIPQ